jgi:hypothetical protein
MHHKDESRVTSENVPGDIAGDAGEEVGKYLLPFIRGAWPGFPLIFHFALPCL